MHLNHVKYIAQTFCSECHIENIEEICSGNINSTFLVTYVRNSCNYKFVLQSLNKKVFRDPNSVIANLQKIGSHVQPKLDELLNEFPTRRWELPKLIRTSSGEDFFEYNDQFWRAITYIDRSTNFTTFSYPSQVVEVGFALAAFHYIINDISPHLLSQVISHFHDSLSYLIEYDHSLSEASKYDSSDNHLQNAIEFVHHNRHCIDLLEQAKVNLEIKKKISHGDPKISNFLFDDSTLETIGMIDLDTVQPGYLISDLADCIRSACNPAGEQPADINDVKFDLLFFRSFLQGYSSSFHGNLTLEDYHYLPQAILVLPFELGVRFLTDHLKGDCLFKSGGSDRNLFRARVQFKLYESVNNQITSINLILSELRNHFF